MIRLSALTLAAFVILFFALLVEGRIPVAGSILRQILPLAGLGAAAWSITEWKRQGGIIALASGGRSPWTVALLFIICLCPLVLMPHLMRSPDSERLVVTPSRVIAHYDRATAFEWTGVQTLRRFNEGVAIGPRIPKPDVRASSGFQWAWWTVAAQLILSAFLVYWLIFTSTHRLGVIMSVTGVVVGLSEFLFRLEQLL